MRKNISQKSINEYLKKVRRAMPASGRPEQLYLRRLQSRLTEYAGAHPVESFDSLVEQFGTPEDTALACYRNAGDDLLLRRLSFRKLLFGTIFLRHSVFFPAPSTVTALHSTP